MKKSLITIASVLLFSTFLFGVQFFYWAPNWKKITDRCIDYNPQWSGMLDCYGIISIWQSNNSGYLIQKNTEPGPIVAQIRKVDDFVVKNNEIYLVDITPKEICNNLIPGKYCGTFQVNGKSKSYYYDTPNEVPTYRVFDIKTGNERFYSKLVDMPSSDQLVFKSLINQ